MILYKKAKTTLLFSLPLASLLFLLSLPAQLQASSFLRGDIENGQMLAEKQCARCHGDYGISDDGDIDTPGLASQNAVYMFKQLRDYKFKRREDRDMYRRARRLETQQMIDIAIWYESQGAPEVDVEKIAALAVPTLVTKGDPSRRIPACATCHSDTDGNRVRGINPRLVGKSAEYVTGTLEDFRDGSRRNDPGAIMRVIARRLTDDDIRILANYYAITGAGPVDDF